MRSTARRARVRMRSIRSPRAPSSRPSRGCKRRPRSTSRASVRRRTRRSRRTVGSTGRPVSFASRSSERWRSWRRKDCRSDDLPRSDGTDGARRARASGREGRPRRRHRPEARRFRRSRSPLRRRKRPPGPARRVLRPPPGRPRARLLPLPDAVLAGPRRHRARAARRQPRAGIGFRDRGRQHRPEGDERSRRGEESELRRRVRPRERSGRLALPRRTGGIDPPTRGRRGLPVRARPAVGSVRPRERLLRADAEGRAFALLLRARALRERSAPRPRRIVRGAHRIARRSSAPALLPLRTDDGQVRIRDPERDPRDRPDHRRRDHRVPRHPVATRPRDSAARSRELVSAMWKDFPLFPESASSVSGRVDALLFFLLGLSAFFATLICTVIVVFSFKYRRRPDNLIATPIEGSLLLELTWMIIPFGLTMVIFVWGAQI